MRGWSVDVRNDIARTHQSKNVGQRRSRVADMNHQRNSKPASNLMRTPDGVEVALAGQRAG